MMVSFTFINDTWVVRVVELPGVRCLFMVGWVESKCSVTDHISIPVQCMGFCLEVTNSFVSPFRLIFQFFVTYTEAALLPVVST